MSLSVSIPLKQIGRQDAYELQLELHEANEHVSHVEQRGTTAALLGFLDEKARLDRELSEERTQYMRYRQDTNEKRAVSSEREAIRHAELFGRKIRDIGDEFMQDMLRDSHIVSFVQDMVEPSEKKSATETAFDHFCEVVNVLFECNDSGVGK